MAVQDNNEGARAREGAAKESEPRLMMKAEKKEMPRRIAVSKTVRRRGDEAQAAVDKLNESGVGGGGRRIQVDRTRVRIDPKTGERTEETEYDVGRPMSETEFGLSAGETEAQWKKRQEMKKAADEMRRRQLEQPLDIFELARMARE